VNETTVQNETEVRLREQLSSEQRTMLTQVIDDAQERQADELNEIYESVIASLADHFRGMGPAIVAVAQHARANIVDARRLDDDLVCRCLESAEA
jgi:hypothetical protein